MAVTIYDRGQYYESQYTFTDEDSGDPVDPDEVYFFYKIGNAAVVQWTYGEDDEITRESEGVYSIRLYLGTPGPWWRAWQGLGDEEGKFDEASFAVTNTKITPVSPS